MSTPTLPENETEFMAWLTQENRRRDIVHLQQLRGRYEGMQMLCLFLMALWLVGLYIGYQVGVVPPEIAGVITVGVACGGTYIWWYLRRLKRGVIARLLTLRQEEPTA